MSRLTRVLAFSILTLALSTSAARADGFIAPYFGAAFGGTVSDVDIFDEGHRPLTYGVAIGGMGGGIFGFEADIAFTPDFFGDSDDEFLGSNSVTSVMGNVLIGAPIGGQTGPGVRPYFAAGVGLLRQRVEAFDEFDEFSSSNFGYNLGGGIFVYFTDNFGIRGDYRYFRNFQEDDDSFFFDVEPGTLNYSRATVAAVIRF